jgi:hypothetical protein
MAIHLLRQLLREDTHITLPAKTPFTFPPELWIRELIQ